MAVSYASVCLVYTGNLRHMLGNRHVSAHRRLAIPSRETSFSDMGVNAPKCLFPPEPKHYGGPKLKVAIIGAGLAGMSTAVELLDQGHEVDIYESRSIIGGKVGSFVDKQGNHIEMGLHVFIGCYSNLFRLLKKVGADKNLLVKEYTHHFVNKGGEIGGKRNAYINFFNGSVLFISCCLKEPMNGGLMMELATRKNKVLEDKMYLSFKMTMKADLLFRGLLFLLPGLVIDWCLSMLHGGMWLTIG